VTIAAASDLYVHTVSVEAFVNRNPDWGGATYAAPVAVQCLIVEETKLVKAQSGTDVISTTQVYAGPAAGAVLQPESRVVLPPASHRPTGATTVVIALDSIVVGDTAVDGVTAYCE
jgi:hypothetical protein